MIAKLSTVGCVAILVEISWSDSNAVQGNSHVENISKILRRLSTNIVEILGFKTQRKPRSFMVEEG